MIQLSNTPNLMGITIRGDREDLHELYQAIGRYSELYHTESIENIDKQLKENKITEIQAENGYYYYSDIHDCILGLNYDIRHAFQGDRNVEFVENGADRIGRAAACIYEVDEALFEAERQRAAEGNLYFSVEILYPWMLYYMINFQSMLDGWYDEKILKKLDFKYGILQCRRDRSILTYFVMEVWRCLSECIGEKKIQRAYVYTDKMSLECSCNNHYGTALCNYYCDRKKTSKRLRKAMLLAMIYEFVGVEFLYSRRKHKQNSAAYTEYEKDYQDALKCIEENTGNPFLTQSKVMNDLQQFMEGKEYFSHEDQEVFFERYGEVDWNKLKW